MEKQPEHRDAEPLQRSRQAFVDQLEADRGQPSAEPDIDIANRRAAFEAQRKGRDGGDQIAPETAHQWADLDARDINGLSRPDDRRDALVDVHHNMGNDARYRARLTERHPGLAAEAPEAQSAYEHETLLKEARKGGAVDVTAFQRANTFEHQARPDALAAHPELEGAYNIRDHSQQFAQNHIRGPRNQQRFAQLTDQYLQQELLAGRVPEPQHARQREPELAR